MIAENFKTCLPFYIKNPNQSSGIIVLHVYGLPDLKYP